MQSLKRCSMVAIWLAQKLPSTKPLIASSGLVLCVLLKILSFALEWDHSSFMTILKGDSFLFVAGGLQSKSIFAEWK